MIVLENFILDTIIHIVIILLINLYIINIVQCNSINRILVVSILLGIIITYISHIYFPKLRLLRIIKKLETI
jgi:hypothetical protein